MTSTVPSNRLMPIVALLLVQLIFGFNYAASKVILSHYPPVLWGAIRMSIAAVLMFIFSFALVSKHQRVINREFLWKTFIYSLFGISLNQAFFLIGLKHTTTSNAAILNTLTPIFTLVFAIFARKERWTKLRAVGFLIAICGVMVLKNFNDFSLGSDTWKGDFFTLLNCASLAMFFILSGDFMRKNSPFWATAWMFLFGAVAMFLFSIPDLGMAVPHMVSGTFMLAVVYNIIFATMLTYFLNSWTLSRVSPSSVAIYIYLQPVIAVLNGWFSLGETPSPRTVLAMACIFFGVGVASFKKA